MNLIHAICWEMTVLKLWPHLLAASDLNYFETISWCYDIFKVRNANQGQRIKSLYLFIKKFMACRTKIRNSDKPYNLCNITHSTKIMVEF